MISSHNLLSIWLLFHESIGCNRKLSKNMFKLVVSSVCADGLAPLGVSMPSQWAHYAIMTSLLHQNESFWRNYVKMTSFWHNNDVIITSCVQGVGTRHCDGHITWVIASQTPVPRLFVELLVRANSKENTKAPHYRPCAFVSGFHRCGFPS